MPRRPLLALPVATLVLALASPARARDRDDDELARARALYDEAGQLEEKGRFPEAQERLRDALAIRETANLRYALGWALEHGGNVANARLEYESALRLAERSGNDEVVRLSRERLLATETPAGPTSAPPAPAARPASPHARPAPARVAESASPPSTVPPSTVPWALVGAGGALVATGVALLALSSADAERRDDATSKWCAATACVGNSIATRPESAAATAARRDAEGAASRGNAKQAIGFTLGGVGVVAAGVGTYLLLRRHTEEVAVRRVSVDAGVAPGLASASATVRF